MCYVCGSLNNYLGFDVWEFFFLRFRSVDGLWIVYVYDLYGLGYDGSSELLMWKCDGILEGLLGVWF